jgi:hypothetical protein
MFQHVLMTRQVSVWPKSLSCFPCLHLLNVERIYTLTECSTADCKTVRASSASPKPNTECQLKSCRLCFRLHVQWLLQYTRPKVHNAGDTATSRCILAHIDQIAVDCVLSMRIRNSVPNIRAQAFERQDHGSLQTRNQHAASAVTTQQQSDTGLQADTFTHAAQ